MIDLRDYQEAAVNSIVPALNENRSTLLSACVGAGKTVIQAEFFRRIKDEIGGARMISLAHTRELVQQNSETMLRLWPGAPVGINSASLGRRDTRSPLIFASIQSVAKQAKRIGYIDIASIDECHLLPTDEQSMYQTFLGELAEINPDLRLFGMSGTPFRLDSGWLHKGKNRLFESLCYEISIPELIYKGYLVPPITQAMENKFDVSNVNIRAGEYAAGDLQKKLMSGSVSARAASELVNIGVADKRKSWIVFCAGVEHAYQVRDFIRARGISCETVEGNLDAKERAQIIAAFKARRIRCLTNVNVLSIGFDYQGVDLLALMRPTKSNALYIQQVGRGLRCLGRNIEESIKSGKENCRVLDFAGLIETLGPVDEPTVKRGDSNGDKAEFDVAPMKVCPSCKTYMSVAIRVCKICEHEFSTLTVEDKITPKPSNSNILSAKARDGYREVDAVSFARHAASFDKPATMRVEYHSGRKVIKEWVCFDHPIGSFPKRKAAAWWFESGGNLPSPDTVADALDRTRELRTVVAVKTREEDGYDRVIARRFARRDERAAG